MQKFKMENPVHWEKANCVSGNFRLQTATSNFRCGKITTYLDFAIFVNIRLLEIYSIMRS